MDTELKHTLVQYHGGGYDGCFWEWNYFYIDHDGQFHDVQSSGRAGCTTTEDAEQLLAENSKHTYTYDVTDSAAIAEFSRESNAVHAKGVLQWFNAYNAHEADTFVQFYAVCSECGKPIDDANDAHLEEWHGCGGIASTANCLLCSDCLSAGQCYICNEYVGRAGLDYEQDVDDCSEAVQVELQEWDENNGPACQYCWETKRDSLIADERQELLTISLATGTPDLFDNDMQWFWS